MNLYMVVFIASMGAFCYFDSETKINVEFFTDVKQAIVFSEAKRFEVSGCLKYQQPQIFKIEPHEERYCDDLDTHSSIAYRECLREADSYEFKVYEIDAIPLKPVEPAIKYEIIESTVTIKDVDNNKENK